jgi:hypothetical protein
MMKKTINKSFEKFLRENMNKNRKISSKIKNR